MALSTYAPSVAAVERRTVHSNPTEENTIEVMNIPKSKSPHGKIQRIVAESHGFHIDYRALDGGELRIYAELDELKDCNKPEQKRVAGHKSSFENKELDLISEDAKINNKKELKESLLQSELVDKSATRADRQSKIARQKNRGSSIGSEVKK